MFHNRFFCTGLLACSLALAGTALAQNAGTQPDNTKANKQMATTADQQKNNVTDRELSQKFAKLSSLTSLCPVTPTT